MNYVKLMAGLACLGLANCVSLLPDAGPGPDIYRLSTTAQNLETSSTARVLLLPVVKAPKELKNNRVALIRDGNAISYAANARWASSTPEMLQGMLADVLAADGELVVVAPADGVDTDFEIRVTLRAFEANYDQGVEAPPMGVVRFQVRLLDRKNRSLVAESSFSAEQRASDVRLGSVVRAIDLAAHRAAENITEWVKSQDTSRS